MKKLFAAITLFLFLSPAFAQSANDLFQQALVMERSEGNLQEAISLYERVVATGSDRSLAAKALIRIGVNYERQGLRQARQAYQRVLDDYSDQRDTAQVARNRLSSLLSQMAREEPQKISGSVVKKHVIDIPDNMGEVSRDGRFLSFVEWNSGNVGYVNLETGEQTLVNSDGSWAEKKNAFGDRSIWSPDGKELMYQWIFDDGSEIRATETRVYNMKTGETSIFFPPGSDSHPFPITWSNDGGEILAISEWSDHVTDAITLVNVETADTRVITTLSENWHTFEMDLSPDNKHIVFESFETGQRNNRNAPVAIKIQSTDGRNQVTLVEDGYKNYSPAWTNDGKHVLYVSLRGDSAGLWTVAVENGKAVGQPRPVYSGFDGNVFPEGITDDGRFFYSQGTREFNVYEQGVNFVTGQMQNNLRVISSSRYGMQRSGAISPDGRYLAFVSEQLGESLLVITELGSGETKVHDFSERGRIQVQLWRSVSWSSDSKSILVGSNTRTRPRKHVILSVSAQDGSFTKLEGFEDYDIQNQQSVKGKGYSADGRSVVFAAPHHLVEMDISSSKQRIIHDFHDRNVIAMSLSPDRETAAVVVRASGSSNSSVAKIELLSIASGKRSTVDEAKVEFGYSNWVGVSWTPDGRHLVFAENRPNEGQQLFVVDIESGHRTALGDPVFGDDQYSAVRVHPEGDKLTFWRGRAQLQLWVLDGIEL